LFSTQIINEVKKLIELRLLISFFSVMIEVVVAVVVVVVVSVSL
jgi:hypothetical protein